MLTVDLIMNPNIPDAIVVMTTVENEEQAVRIARQLASSPALRIASCRLCAGLAPNDLHLSLVGER
jgi:hypothetical protein